MSFNKKFLIAEDDPVSRLRLQRTLEKRGFKVIPAEDGQEGWEIFEKDKGNIYFAILDQTMPRMNGTELCRQIKNAKVSHYVYVIFLSAKEEIKDIVSGFEAGADDYVTKPFDSEELFSRIKVGLRIVELEQKLKRAYAKLQKAYQKLRIMAVTDALTGILNRRALFERIGIEVNKACREESGLCLIMLDIDHFKELNDQYGHLIGDEILTEVAKRLKSQIRPYDLLGRYGGEEFLIAILGASEEVGESIAERLRASISENEFVIDDKRIKITVSLGLVYAKMARDDKVDEIFENLLRAADQALYKAKEMGRNKVVNSPFMAKSSQ